MKERQNKQTNKMSKHVMFADDSVTGESSVDVRSYDYCDQQSQCSSVSIDFSLLKENGNLRGNGGFRGSALESWENEERQRLSIRNSITSTSSNDFSVTDNNFMMNMDEAATYFAMMNKNNNSPSRTGSFHKGSQIQFDSAFDEESLADSVLSGASFALDGMDGDNKLGEFALDDKSLQTSEFDVKSQSHPTMDEIGSEDFMSLAEESYESEVSLKDPPPSVPLMRSSSFMRSEKRKQRTRNRLRAYSEKPMRSSSVNSISSIPRRNNSNRSLSTRSPTGNPRRDSVAASLGTSSARIPRRSSLGASSANNTRRSSLGSSSANNPRRYGSPGASGAHILSNAHNTRRSSLGSNNPRNTSLGASSAHNPRRNGSLGSMAATNPRRNGSLGALQKRTSNSLKTESCHAAVSRRAGSLRAMASIQSELKRNESEATAPFENGKTKAAAATERNESEVSRKNGKQKKVKAAAAAAFAMSKIISPKMEKAMKLKLGSDLRSGRSPPVVSRSVSTPLKKKLVSGSAAQRQHLLG